MTGAWPHRMLEEIHAQPAALVDTLAALRDPAGRLCPPLPVDPAEVRRVTLVASGSSFHAAMVAKLWIEEIAGLPAEVDIAPEFRHRRPPPQPGGLAVLISQSGETADTLAALAVCRAAGLRTLAVVNVADNAMARAADAVLTTRAGAERAVASTKGFTAQLAALAALAVALGRERGALDAAAEATLTRALAELPGRVAEALALDAAVGAVAERLAEARNVVYTGRGAAFPIALEGALKLKETSYVHAEGFSAGEMRHGPIAMLDAAMPVVALAPPGPLFAATLANAREAAGHGAPVVWVSDAEGVARFGDAAFAALAVPPAPAFVAPMVYAVPMQLLAYRVAALKGLDLDRPRHLTKSLSAD